MKGDGAQAASRAIPKDRTSADRILRSTPITPRSTFINPPFNSSLGRRGELLRTRAHARDDALRHRRLGDPPWSLRGRDDSERTKPLKSRAPLRESSQQGAGVSKGPQTQSTGACEYEHSTGPSRSTSSGDARQFTSRLAARAWPAPGDDPLPCISPAQSIPCRAWLCCARGGQDNDGVIEKLARTKRPRCLGDA